MLQSTLERAVLAMGIPTGLSRECREDLAKAERVQRDVLAHGLERCGLAYLEHRLIREFKRRAHHYRTDLPEEGDRPEWLALMRHYGAPARLVDWTYSFWVAIFFAVEGASDECALWALNSDWAAKRAEGRLPDDAKKALKGDARRGREPDPTMRRPETFRKVFGRRLALVMPVNPHRLNERLTIQQGIFLCPGDVRRPFEDNLAAMLGRSDRKELMKITLPDDVGVRKDILRQLYRMNVNRAVLFPGLDGFAQSLDTFLVWAHLFRRSTDHEWFGAE